MMKKFKYTLLLMLFSFFGFSQQLPHYSLYMFNDAIINPAICGTKDYNRIDLVSRSQWAGFEGAPKTQLLSYQRSQGKNMGIGGSIFNDETGPSKRTGVQLSYAYNFLISDNYTLSLGLAEVNTLTFIAHKLVVIVQLF
jgi:type IX secretion system PorP/SprF family membrane protein